LNERLFARLQVLLRHEPVVLASVLETRGATPRKGGSKMLITVDRTEFSVGGGLAEARVIAAARALLDGAHGPSELRIDLSGKPGAAGVCGGVMRVALRRWQGAQDRARVRELNLRLKVGECAHLLSTDLGAETAHEIARPDPRLLIVGGGHCGLALYELARYLDFDIWVFDPRAECFADARFASAHRLSGGYERLALALKSPREVYAVCLNRDFHGDVEALRVLSRTPPKFLGVMGSRKRIAEVAQALPECATLMTMAQAPVGTDIGAQTPHEIAVSILAQLIQAQRGQS
jgi:xanthine dehydrogenase accessory factor